MSYKGDSFTVTVRNIDDPSSTIHYGRTAEEALRLANAVNKDLFSSVTILREEGLKMSPDGVIIDPANALSTIPENLNLSNIGKPVSIEVEHIDDDNKDNGYYAGYLESFFIHEEGFIIVLKGFPYKLVFRKDTHKVTVELSARYWAKQDG